MSRARPTAVFDKYTALRRFVSPTLLAELRRQTDMAGWGAFDRSGDWLISDGSAPPTLPDDARKTCEGAAITAAARPVLVIPLPETPGEPPVSLALWDDRPCSDLELHKRLARATGHIFRTAMARRDEEALVEKTLVERAAATARIGVWSCSLPDEELIWGDGVYDLFGLPRGLSITRQLILDLYEPASLQALEDIRRRSLQTLEDFSLDVLINTPQGDKRWIRITATTEVRNGVPVRLFGMKQDVTEQKQLVEYTKILAETDSLTGLANRAVFQKSLSDLHGRAGGPGVSALLLVDLDHFKPVNDTIGHLHGDACLVEAARRLQACAPADALVCRIGGDEFAVLLPQAIRQRAENLAQSITAAFAQPFALAKSQQQLGASIGLALVQPGHTPDTLYHDADTALYAAKSAGRSTWRSHTASAAR